MSKSKGLRSFAELANESLDAAREEIAVLAGMPGSAEPLFSQIHTALDKLAEALSWTQSALDEQRKQLRHGGAP